MTFYDPLRLLYSTPVYFADIILTIRNAKSKLYICCIIIFFSQTKCINSQSFLHKNNVLMEIFSVELVSE